MGVPRGGLDRIPERSGAVARRSQTRRARSRRICGGGSRRRQGEKVRLVAAHDGAAEAPASLRPSRRSSSSRSATSGFATPARSCWAAAMSGARRALASTDGAANMICRATRTSASGLPGRRAALREGRLGPRGRCDRRRWVGHGDHDRAMPPQSQPQHAHARGGRAAASARPRVRARHLARVRPPQRPYRWPRRQSRPLRRTGSRRDSDAGPDDPNAPSIKTPPVDCAQPSSRSSPCPHRAASSTRTAT